MDKKIRRAHEAQSLKLWEQVQRTVENVLKGKALMRTEKKERGYINNIQKILQVQRQNWSQAKLLTSGIPGSTLHI